MQANRDKTLRPSAAYIHALVLIRYLNSGMVGITCLICAGGAKYAPGGAVYSQDLTVLQFWTKNLNVLGRNADFKRIYRRC